MQWTERETLDTTITTIELAYEGHMEKLRLAQVNPFGVTASPQTAMPAEPMPAESVFDLLRRRAAEDAR